MKSIGLSVSKSLAMLFFPLFFLISKNLNDSISTTLLDNFENLSLWEEIKSDGVDIEISNEPGLDNKCFQINFNFKLGSGYCGIRKKVNLDLPDNYKFTFYIKGNTPVNNLEFKLIDSTGENVWWLNQRNFEFPSDWKKIEIKKRDISFAWGPAGGGEIKKIGFIEIIISSSTGGRGTIYIDKLEIEEIEPDSIRQKITDFEILSSSGEIHNAIDQNHLTFWESNEEKPYIIIDFKSVKEYGGLIINWSEEHYANKYKILTSTDSSKWNEVYSVSNGSGGKNYIFLKDCESRFIKIQFLNSPTGKYKIYEISIKDPSFSSSINEFFKHIANDFPEGYFPKYFRNKQTYWTVIGLPYDDKEALVSEDGIIEVDKSGFTIEPFLLINKKFYTYNHASIVQSLEEEYLPIPVVNWGTGSVKMEIKSFVSGNTDSSFIMVRYELENTDEKTISGDLFIAIRPFQVLPPWQQLNIVGGATKIREISYSDQIVKVNDKKIILKSTPDDVGFSEFDHGEIVKYLSAGALPKKKNVKCSLGYASGAIKYSFTLKSKAKKSFCLVIPLSEGQNLVNLKDKNFDEELGKVKNLWKNLLNFETTKGKIVIEVPDKKLINTLKSNLAYILINGDKPKNGQNWLTLQPGSRTYERSWIRDGALISSSLLYFGFHEIVKQYIEWYSKYQYENGKIPCVVDFRGPDPVPEHDSNGEFIYLLANYFKFTKDTSLLQNKFETVKKAIDYISYLTSLRKNAEFKSEDKRAYYGLLTESISHEGYSAKPMHSYWDNFWALLGLKSATMIAKILGKENEAKVFEQIESEFKTNLYNSLEFAIKNKNINYIPGCVELGDFDPTSTAIAIFPTFAFENAPDTLRYYLINTFKKYKDFFTQRDSLNNWLNYTPYELRLCATFIYLGDKEFAHKMMDFFIQHQRPYNWNMWAEVVWNTKDYPGYIGDMPHSWVGAEFINSFRSMFVYEIDSTLFLLPGVKDEWLLPGKKIILENMPTSLGKINIYVKSNNNKIEITLKSTEISNLLSSKKGIKILLLNPINKMTKKVYINHRYFSNSANRIEINFLPSKIEFIY